MKLISFLGLAATMTFLAACDADRDDQLGDRLEGGGSYESDAATPAETDAEADAVPEPASTSTSAGPRAGATVSGGIPGTGSEGMKSAGDPGVSDR